MRGTLDYELIYTSTTGYDHGRKESEFVRNDLTILEGSHCHP